MRTLSETEVKKYSEEILEKIRSIFEKDHQLRPVSILMATVDPRTNEKLEEPQTIIILAQSMANEEEKIGYSNFIREISARSESIFVVFATEAWSVVSSTKEPLAEDTLKKYAGRLNEHPSRQEIVMVTLDLALGGSSMWIAEIKRDGANTPTLGPWKNMMSNKESAEGKFANLAAIKTVPSSNRSTSGSN